MNKKIIISLIISLIFGFISAQIVFNYYKKNLLENSYNAYIIKVNGKNEDDEYYIFDDKDDSSVVGITTNIINANKIKKIFDEAFDNVYISPVAIENNEFVSNLQQYDILISEVDDEKNLMSINDAILSSYRELVLKIE